MLSLDLLCDVNTVMLECRGLFSGVANADIRSFGSYAEAEIINLHLCRLSRLGLLARN